MKMRRKGELLDSIMAWEMGEMHEEDEVEFFQELINNGMAWTLQGCYGRNARALIEAGLCYPKGEKIMTIYEIKRRVEEAGNINFFSPKTMRFFGQTLRDFSVRKVLPGFYRICAPIRDREGKTILGIRTEYIFNAETNTLEWGEK